MGYLSAISEFRDFLRERKRFWLLPLVLVLIALGAVIVLTANSAFAPFIYSIF